MDDYRIDNGRQAASRPPFMGRIAPRRAGEGDPTEWRSVPRGDEPAKPGRPFLATVSVVLFLYAAWIQTERFQDCRDAGGGAVACFLAPVF